METVFRDAAPADAPAIARLITAAWKKAYRGILPDAILDKIDEQKRAERVSEGIRTKPEQRYAVLEADGEIAGVSVVCPCRDDDLPGAAEIRVFYIHPDRQRHGLGRTLMAHTLAAIRTDGSPQVTLWVLRDNLAARAFYEAMGFQFDGSEKAVPELESAAVVRYRYHGEGVLP